MAFIEKRSGRENYATWRFVMKTYLEHEELWNCIESDSKEVDAKRKTKAKTKIIQKMMYTFKKLVLQKKYSTNCRRHFIIPA